MVQRTGGGCTRGPPPCQAHTVYICLAIAHRDMIAKGANEHMIKFSTGGEVLKLKNMNWGKSLPRVLRGFVRAVAYLPWYILPGYILLAIRHMIRVSDVARVQCISHREGWLHICTRASCSIRHLYTLCSVQGGGCTKSDSTAVTCTVAN